METLFITMRRADGYTEAWRARPFWKGVTVYHWVRPREGEWKLEDTYDR